MNYIELSQSIQSYAENTESLFVENIPTFVKEAERRIFNTVQLPSLRKNVTGTMTNGNKYVALPNDWLANYSLAVIDAAGAYSYLLNKDVNFIREAYPTPADTGLPEYYAIFGPNSGDDTELSLLLGPTPNSAYNVELHYFYYPESIVTAGQSWLGDNFDSALLNGALLQALRFIKGEGDMIAMYDKLYLQAIMLLKQLGDGKLRQDAYRSGQVRDKVS